MTIARLRGLAWVVVVLAIVGIGIWAARREAGAPQTAAVPAAPSAGAEMKPVAGVGGAFTLTDQHGRRFTEADLQGRPTAMFFGYTFCPDVCPTTLLEVEGWMRELGADADRLRVVFVTVDPERDTAEKLATYLANFDPRFIGLSGSRAEIDRIVKAYRVVARKVDNPGGDYTMDHTAAVYLLDAQGRFVAIVNFQEATDKALIKVRRLIAAAKGS